MEDSIPQVEMRRAAQLLERLEPPERFQEVAVEGSAGQEAEQAGPGLSLQSPQVALLASVVVAALVAEQKPRLHQAPVLLAGFTAAEVVAVVVPAPQATAETALLAQSSSNTSLWLLVKAHCFTSTSVLV